MLKCKLTILIIVLSLVLPAAAQYDPELSHYFDLEASYNPAAVGKAPKMNIAVAYNMGLVGFENNPKTMYLSADMPFYFLTGYHGAGLQLMNDQIGLFKHQRIEGEYAYKHKLFGGTLSVGVQAGLLSESFDGSKLDLEDSSDPAFSSSEVTGNAFDLGAGLYYNRGPLYLGLSAQHLTAPTVELGETNELKIDRTYYFTGGYNIKLKNPFLTIKPSVMFRTDGVAYRGDITGRLVYKNENKEMYGGLSYSPTNSLTLLIGGNVQGVIIGYSYEYYTKAISFYNGSHELFIGYQMDMNFDKKGRNKHKSVRIL